MLDLLLRNKDFSFLWTSQIISQSGNRMFQIALSWWVLSGTPEGNSYGLAMVMIAASLPPILLVKVIGIRVEKEAPRNLLLLVDGIGIAVCGLLFFLFYSEKASLLTVLPLVFILSTLCAFIEPTLQKNVSGLVRKKDMEHCMAFLSSTQTVAAFIGAVIGAFLIEHVGIALVALVNCASFVVSCALDASIGFKARKVDEHVFLAAKPLKTRELFGQYPAIRDLLFSFVGINFFASASLLVIPLYVKNVLDKGASYLSAAEAFICSGIILGSLLSPRLGMKRQTILFIQFCLFTYAACTAIGGLVLPASVYLASLVFAGLCIGAMTVRLMTYMHQVLPENIKGRFFASIQAVVGSALPVSFVVFGLVSRAIPDHLLPVLQAFGVVVVAFSLNSAKSKESILDMEVVP